MFGLLTSKEIQSRYIQGIIKRTEIEIVRNYWLLDKEPSCKVHWIELAAKSEGIAIPNFDETEPILGDNDDQLGEISNYNNESIINSGNNSAEEELLPEETPHIILDYIRLN